jgi:hypothetical protein
VEFSDNPSPLEGEGWVRGSNNSFQILFLNRQSNFDPILIILFLPFDKLYVLKFKFLLNFKEKHGENYETPLTLIRHTACAPSEGRGIILVAYLDFAKASLGERGFHL